MAKICMLVSEDHTTHPIIRRQVPTLIAAGHEVSVLDPCDPAPGRMSRYRRTRVHPVNLQLVGKVVWIFLRRVNERVLGEPWWTVIYFAQMFLTSLRYAGAAFAEGADYYHAHDMQTFLAAIIVGRLKRRSVIYDAHELQSEEGSPTALPNRVMRVIERRLVPLADHLIVPNVSRAKVYTSRCALRAEPTVILNCPPMAEVSRTNVIRERLGLSPATRVVLYHGTFMPGRALEELMRAARAFAPDIVLVMIGRQNRFYEDVLRPLHTLEELDNKVFFVPYVHPDEVLSYVAAADLGVVIYKSIDLNNYLCAPTKLYEYLMAGVPVAVCNFPEMRALLDEFPVGVSFDPDNPESISHSVNDFFSLPMDRLAGIQRSVASARQWFTWEVEGQKLLSLYAAPKAEACPWKGAAAAGPSGRDD